MNQIRTNIDIAMRLRGLDKSKLSRRLGCSHTAVGNKLSGKAPISIDEVEVFAEVLDVPYRVLLGEPADVLRYFADHDPAFTVPQVSDRELSGPEQGQLFAIAA